MITTRATSFDFSVNRNTQRRIVETVPQPSLRASGCQRVANNELTAAFDAYSSARSRSLSRQASQRFWLAASGVVSPCETVAGSEEGPAGTRAGAAVATGVAIVGATWA